MFVGGRSNLGWPELVILSHFTSVKFWLLWLFFIKSIWSPWNTWGKSSEAEQVDARLLRSRLMHACLLILHPGHTHMQDRCPMSASLMFSCSTNCRVLLPCTAASSRDRSWMFVIIFKQKWVVKSRRKSHFDWQHQLSTHTNLCRSCIPSLNVTGAINKLREKNWDTSPTQHDTVKSNIYKKNII